MKPTEIKVDELPGVREAILQESEIRAEAFVLGAREFICGVEVLPLSFTLVNLLRACGSPFIRGARNLPSPLQVAQFLWACSPEYQAAQQFRDKIMPWSPVLANKVFERKQYSFGKKIRRIPYGQAVAHIDKYIADAYADSMGSDGAGIVVYYHGQAAAVAMMAAKFGWTEDQILNMPMKRVWQYLRWIVHTSSNKPLPNKSDKVRKEAVKKKLEELKQEECSKKS